MRIAGLLLGAAATGIAVWLFLRPAPPPDVSPAPSPSPTPPGAKPELTDAERERALYTEALAAVTNMLAAFPGNDDAVYLAGLIQNDFGDKAAAEALWKQSLELDPSRADAWNSLGSLLMNDDDYLEAEHHFRKALEQNPALADAKLNLAKTLSHQGQMAEVVSILESFPRLTADAYQLLGEARQQLKQFAKARDAYEQALELEPDLKEAHYALSRVCARLGERDKASVHWARFSELKSSDDERARRTRDDYSPLEVARKQAAQAQTDIGRVYLSQGRQDDAVNFFLRARDLDSANTMCRLQLAVVAQQLGKPDEALTFYEEVAAIDPEDPLTQLNLGRLCVGTGRHERARTAFNEVIRLKPNQPEGYAALVRLHLRTRQNLAEARNLSQKAVDLAPTAAHYELLSQACAANRDATGAIAALDKALELDPANQRYLQMRALLQQQQ